MNKRRVSLMQIWFLLLALVLPICGTGIVGRSFISWQNVEARRTFWRERGAGVWIDNGKVTAIHFTGGTCDNEDLRHAATEKGLKRIYAPTNSVTDDGIQFLENHVTLNDIYLPHSHISDRALESFRSMQSLAYVNIEGANVSIRGLQSFSALRPDVIIDHWDQYGTPARTTAGRLKTRRL